MEFILTKHYRDYYWKDGLPQGLSAFNLDESIKGLSYKISSDPYHRRVSIEKYIDEDFDRLIYDSGLFDFRHLHPSRQTTWQKTQISETKEQVISHIRDQDDRLLLIEDYRFENHLCRECRASSPFGILLSIQKIYYKTLGDDFNGVTLVDCNDHTVLLKRYEFDENSQEFTQLLEEQWDMKSTSLIKTHV